MAYPDNNQVSTNTRLKYNFGEKAQALINPSRNIKAPARQFYDWLIKPIEKDLKLSGVS